MTLDALTKAGDDLFARHILPTPTEWQALAVPDDALPYEGEFTDSAADDDADDADAGDDTEAAAAPEPFTAADQTAAIAEFMEAVLLRAAVQGVREADALIEEAEKEGRDDE